MLESAGILRSIKRVAGASAGAIIAALISLGYDSSDLREFLEQDLRRILVGMFYISCVCSYTVASINVSQDLCFYTK